MNEDAAWQHLIDLQREMENSRLLAARTAGIGRWAWHLAQRMWLLAGIAAQRAPRRNPATVLDDGEEARSTRNAA